MVNIQDLYDRRLERMVDEFDKIDIASDDFTSATKNLAAFSQVRPLLHPADPDPIPVPETRWAKVKCAAASVWDNETTRVLIKAGGAFGGVALVVYSTIYRDHAMERTAIAQANQRNS